MAKRRRSRALRWGGAALAAGVAALLALLFLPLPSPAVAWLANRSSSWILTDYESAGPFPSRAGRKAVGLAVQQSLAAAAVASRPLPEELSDAERIGRRLVSVKRLTISQTELLHSVVNSPTAVAGLGWCDGINGFAAIILSHEFPGTEIVGVVDRGRRAGHSFGRLWSRRHGDWLYFDAWPEEVVVFRSSAGRPPEYLFRQRPLGARPSPPGEDEALLAHLYRQAPSGFVHNRLQPTLGGYVAARLWNLIRHGNRAPPGAAEAVATATLSTGPIDLPSPALNTTPAPGAYVQARVAHLRGDWRAARAAYADVAAAEDGGRSTYGRAARIFIERIDQGLY